MPAQRSRPRGPRLLTAAVAALLAATVVPAVAGSGRFGPDGLTSPGLRAGAATVDATWHVGASQGQYAGEGPGPYDRRTGTVDPSVHSTTSNPTFGVESRDTVRALVFDDGTGRWALLTTDLYIPQDLLVRRVATLLAEHDLRSPATATGITADQLSVTVSHSHSSPFYSSTTWGAWLFQDTFDIRFFEFMARRMADAVIGASTSMRPARAALASTQVAISKRNPESPAISEDDEPLPASWPLTETDGTLSLLRVDDLSGPSPRPLAHWVVFGRHPEGMKDNGLHTGEYIGALQRTIDRELGGVALFSQNDVGTSEIARDGKAHAPEARQEYDENSHNMLERVARQLGDEVVAASRDIDRRWLDSSASLAKGSAVTLVDRDSPVRVSTMRFAPPSYRAFPTVGNCRTERAMGGDPGIPVAGLPTCEYFMGDNIRDVSPVDPGVTYRSLQEAGVPVPDSYGVPSYTGLQESTTVTLQAIRLGEVAFTMCPCEQFTDQTRNIQSRLDKVAGNLAFGWDWTANHRFNPAYEPGVAYVGDLIPDRVLGPGVRRGPVQLDLDPQAPGEQWWCEPDNRATPTQWTCKDPRVLGDAEPAVLPAWSAWPVLPPVSHAAFVRWKARIYNNAAGWDGYVGASGSPDALVAEAEPADPTKVWGNWIHEELTASGYETIVPVSMANSYWGYIPTYREYQARDYYRKALAGLGPHSADFLVTRLTRMAAELKGAPATLIEPTPKDLAYAGDDAHLTARAAAIGALAEAAMPAYEAGLAPDGGTPGAVRQQPAKAVKRFEAASFQWVGGSNYSDVPHARVERLDPASGAWRPFGDGFGEVQVKVTMPTPAQVPLVAAGSFEWVWTATFEAYDSDIDRTFADGVTRSQVPDGTYRFVADGCHRGLAPRVGAAPACSPWDAAGRVSPYRATSETFTVGPWEGITVEDVQANAGWDAVSFRVGPVAPFDVRLSNAARTTFASGVGMLGLVPRQYSIGRFDYGQRAAIDYPDTVGGDPMLYRKARSANDQRTYGTRGQALFCFLCSFEAWAETGAVDQATVTVNRAGGAVDRVPAAYQPATRRWVAAVALGPGDAAAVGAGDVVDTFGERNGAPSSAVRRPLA